MWFEVKQKKQQRQIFDLVNTIYKFICSKNLAFTGIEKLEQRSLTGHSRDVICQLENERNK